MAGPFEAILGRPTALIEREKADEAAMERAELAAGTARRGQDLEHQRVQEQRTILQNAARKWAEIAGRHSGLPQVTGIPPGVTGDVGELSRLPGAHLQPGTPNMTAALREFAMTPDFLLLGSTGANLVNIAQTLSQNPNALEQFTLAPGAQRFDPNRAGPDGRPEMVAENRNRAPGQQGPLDPQRGNLMQDWQRAGQKADETLQQADILEDALIQGGRQQWGVIWDQVRSRVGLPPGTAPRAVAEAMRQRMVNAMREAGTGPMTDDDARRFSSALPHIGNDPAANTTILEVLRRSARTVSQRAELAREAMQANTPEAVDRAMATANNPSELTRRGRQAETRWVAETFGEVEAELAPRSLGEFETLGRRLLAKAGNPPSPRLVRYLRELEMRIKRDHN